MAQAFEQRRTCHAGLIGTSVIQRKTKTTFFRLYIKAAEVHNTDLFAKEFVACILLLPISKHLQMGSFRFK